MIHSIAGQNERWAQQTALQPPPAIQSGQSAASAFSNVGTTTADPSVVNPVAGSTASPLSSNMSFMMMMFGGGLDSASGTGSATRSEPASGSGLTTGSGSTTQTVGSPDDTSATLGGAGLASMLADLQSLISSLTGGASAAANPSASTTASDGTTAASGSGASSTSNSLLQDLDSIASSLGTIAASSGGSQPPPPPPDSASSSQPSGGNDITNNPSAAPSQTWGMNDQAGPGGGWQQFAVAAYTSGNASGSSASVLQNMAV